MKIFKSLKEEYLQEGVYDPGIFKAYFLAGGPGSGKSFVTSSAFAGLGLKLINSDDVLTRYLNKEGLSLKMPEDEQEKRDELRQKAKITTQNRLDLYIQGRLGCIMDGTARDYGKISTQQRLFKFLGYQTIMMFINTSLDVALERNKRRERSIPEYITTNSWNGVQSNMGKFQRLFGMSNFLVVDNNKSDLELTTLTMNRVSKEVRKLIKAPISSYIAKRWMASERKAKRR